jgi:type VI secretion system protein ImpL
MPEPVGGLVAALAQDSATLIAGGARARINNIWTSQVLPFCREAISNRYPFVRGTKREETTLHDFGNMFGPGGRLDAFFTEHLSAIVDTSQRTWRWAGDGIGIDASVLTQFQRAATIREAFFAGGRQGPAVLFELDRRRWTRTSNSSSSTSAGKCSTIDTAQPRPSSCSGPPPGISRARLVLVDLDGGNPASPRRGPGPGTACSTAPACEPQGQEELFRVRFSAGGHWADLTCARRACATRSSCRSCAPSAAPSACEPDP